MVFRKAELHLKDWYLSTRRKPLVLRGARQVGKSTLVRQFAANNGLALAEINLERHLYLNAVFKTLDIDRIIYELEAVAKQKLIPIILFCFWMKSRALPMLFRHCGISMKIDRIFQ